MNKPKSEQTTNQIIAKEGVKSIVLSVILVFLFIFLHLNVMALVFLIVCLFLIVIFRNPERIAEYRKEDMIVAPCDGVIKDVIKNNDTTLLKIKVNMFDVGILRTPIFIDSISTKYKYGLFITGDNSLKEVLNTKHCIDGFHNDKMVYNITLLPEVWNKVSIYQIDSAFAGDRMGFMKYGYLILSIYAPCGLKVEKGQNIFAGQTILGKLF
ncbi:hypothetical protein CCY99_05835 [Helicobacter sp. 16-1353]|uniref:phosphatidylserine decarboxylase n=1 Tax=Helicobacter sp. 16-1353 TaxID=2004996 RepID=UPI000DCB5211|nr:phosphatidylserine decarboxylase [Helicobacter sp. 16-1353]RAX53899.1 hypothetical protein CCY99_05835 [Helicobacter sp. 16-1353]